MPIGSRPNVGPSQAAGRQVRAPALLGGRQAAGQPLVGTLRERSRACHFRQLGHADIRLTKPLTARCCPGWPRPLGALLAQVETPLVERCLTRRPLAAL